MPTTYDWPRSGRVFLPRAVVLAYVVLAAAGGACVRAGSRRTSPAGDVARDSSKTTQVADVVGPVPVEVQNRSSLDAVVFVVRGSTRQRIGSVPPVSNAALTIPASYTDDRAGFSLAAYHLAGNTSYTSDRVVPQPGDRLVLTLQTRLAASTLAFR